MTSKKWIQKARPKKGVLHRQLHIKEGRVIPVKRLRKIEKARIGSHVGRVKVTRLLKRRVNFALNVRKRRR